MKTYLLILFVLIPSVLQAQDASSSYDFFVRGSTVEDAIAKLTRDTKINVAYDSRIDMSGTVFLDLQNKSINFILGKILEGSGLDYIILSTGTYVIINSTGSDDPRTGLRGYVRDARTGEPLPNASVYIADAGSSTYSNNSGYFSFSSLLTGDYQLIATYVGYKARSKEVRINLDDSPVFIIELQPESYMIEPLTVTGDSYRFTNRNTAEEYSIDSDNPVSPYTNSVRSLNAFSGLSFNWAQDEISIQGSSARNHLLTLDGVPLYNNSIAGGTFGVFSPFAIDRIEVSKAAFSAEKGSALSGVINYSHDLIPSEKQVLKLQADPYSVNGKLSGTFTEDEKLSAMVAFRSSVWDQFREPQLNNTLQSWNRLDPLLQNFLMGSDNDIASYSTVTESNNIQFSDLHFASEYRHNSFSRTSLSGYFGYSNSGVNLLSRRRQLFSGQPDYLYGDDNTIQKNQMVQLSHSAVLNSRLDADMQIYYSKAGFYNDYRMVSHENDGSGSTDQEIYRALRAQVNESEQQINRNNLTEWGFKAAIQYNFSKSLKLTTGIDPRVISYEFRLSDQFYRPVNTNDQTLLLSGFSELQNFSGKLGYKFGLRGTYSTIHDKLFLEPRTEVHLQSNEDSPVQQKLILSAGIYRQFVNQFNLSSPGPNALSPSYKFWEPNDATTAVPRSYNLNANWSVYLNRMVSVRVESYYKISDQSWALNYNRILSPIVTGNELSLQEGYFENVQSRNYGGSVSFLITDPESSLYFKLTQESNFAFQRFDERFNGTTQNSPFSEPYSLSGQFKFPVFSNASVSFNGRWTPVRYWAYNESYYNFIETHNSDLFTGIDLSSPGNDRLSYYLRLDAAFNYRFSVKEAAIAMRLDLVNILNRQNEVYRFLNPVQDNNASGISYEQQRRILPGFTPLLTIQLDI